MTRFYQLPPIWQGLIGLWLFFTVGGFLFDIVRRAQQKRRPAAFLLPGLLLLACEALRYAVTFNVTPTGLREGPNAVGRLPALPVAGAALLFTAAAGLLIARTLRRQKNELTAMSVKEGLDTLPTGLCFYEKGGRTLLINHEMEALCQILTGRPLQNGALFWDAVSCGPLPAGCERLSGEPEPILRLPDGRRFRFTRYPAEKGALYETQAADVTELLSAADELRAQGEKIAALNERLRAYGRSVTAATREQEILTAKAQIHDRMNRLLLTTRHCLEDDVSEEEWARMFSLWHGNVLLLCRDEPAARRTDPVAQLEEAAASIGLTLVFHGEMPPENDRARLIMLAAGESLTNAKRHAHAETLTVTVGADFVSFTNDGAPPAYPLHEGGGLGAIRREAEKQGAEMRVAAEGEFRLTLRFPTPFGV